MAILTPRSVLRRYNTDGVPSSGPHNVDKSEFIQLLERIEASGGQAVTRNTLSALNGVTPPTENYMGVVLNDPNPANNGYYSRVGGAWVKGRGFPDTFARVALSGSGTAQTGVVDTGVNPADIEVFFAVVGTDNTGPLMLSIGGEPPRSVVNLAGNPLSAGEWTGVVMFFLNGAGQYQFMLDAGAAQSAAASASAAADDAERSEVAAEAAIGAVSSVSPTEFPSRIWTITNLHPVVAADFIRVAGYSTSGDGGAALYKRVSSEPAHAGKIPVTLNDDVTVVWYEIAETALRTEMFGGGTGNAAQDGAALEDLLEYLLAVPTRGTNVHVCPGNYVMTKGHRLASGHHWHGRDVNLDYSEVSDENLILTSRSIRAHLVGEGTQTSLPPLALNLDRGDFVLTFEAPHGLSNGDVGQIYNPTDNSYSNERSYYRAGELFRVIEVIDDYSICLDRKLYEGYSASEVELFKFNAWQGAVSGFNIIGNKSDTSVTHGLYIDWAKDIQIDDVSATGVSYNTHSVSRTIDGAIRFSSGSEDGVVQYGGDYGLGVYSSQRIFVENCHFLAARHGITAGNIDGSVPYRDVHYRHSSARSMSVGQVSWDWHAIGDHCSMEYCTAGNALSDGVKNMSIQNCRIHNFEGNPTCYISQNQVGGRTRLRDLTLVVDGDYTPDSAAGFIHAGNSTAHTYLREDKFYDIDGIVVEGGGQKANQIVSVWTGNKNHRVSVAIGGVDDPDVNETRLRVLGVFGANNSPIAAHYYTVKDINRLRAGVAYAAYLNTAPAPLACDYPSQHGKVSIAGSLGNSSVVGSAITFPHAYPEAPDVLPSVLTSLGGKRCIANATSISGAGFTPSAITTTEADFTNTNAGTFAWQSMLTRG